MQGSERYKVLSNDTGDYFFGSASEYADHMAKRGEFEKAELIYKKLLKQSEFSAPLHNNLGAVYLSMGRYDDAKDCFSTALVIDPNKLEAYVNLGAFYQLKGQFDKAETCFQNALRINPNCVDACVNLGAIKRLGGKLLEAEATLNHAITCDPRCSEAYNNLGIVLHELGHLKDAFMAFKKTVEINPNYANAYNNMGSVFRDQKQLKPALACYRKAFVLDPTSVEAHNNYGAIYLSLGDLEEAELYFQKALKFRQDFPPALVNLATVFNKKNQHNDALLLFEQAIAIDPDHVDAHFGLAELLLYLGVDLLRGWQEHKWRWKKTEFYSQWREFNCPIWQGEPLDGKSIFVWAEQGVGEEVLYATMIADLIEQGANVFLECEPRLVSLFQRSFSDITCLDRSDSAEHAISRTSTDFHIAMGDLGEWLRPRLSSFPDRSYFLQVDLNHRDKLRKKYKKIGQGPLIGISWKSTNSEIGMDKSLDLSEWSRVLASDPKATFIDLQYGKTDTERKSFEEVSGVYLIHDDTIDQFTDLDGFAAQVAAMDLVISISNTTVHIAGAVGVPTWTLLSSAPLWRWFAGRVDCPWYSSVQLYRQGQRGDWETVISNVSDALDGWLLNEKNYN